MGPGQQGTHPSGFGPHLVPQEDGKVTDSHTHTHDDVQMFQSMFSDFLCVCFFLFVQVSEKLDVAVRKEERDAAEEAGSKSVRRPRG